MIKLDWKEYSVIATSVILIVLGLVLTIGDDILGEFTGEIGGIVGILGISIYCTWLVWKTAQKTRSKEEIIASIRRVPPTSDVPHPVNDLVDNQKDLLARLEKGHWLFTAHYISSMILIPAISIWAFLFLFAAAPPMHRFIIEMAMIGVPFGFFMLLSWFTGRNFRVYFTVAKEYLAYTREAVSKGRGDVEITTYINLLFNVLHNWDVGEEESASPIQTVRSYLWYLKIIPLVEGAVLVSVIATMGLLFNLVAPDFANSIVGYGLSFSFLAIIGFMIIRLVIFLQWRNLMNQWLRIYAALVEWREELEQSFLDDPPQPGGNPP